MTQVRIDFANLVSCITLDWSIHGPSLKEKNIQSSQLVSFVFQAIVPEAKPVEPEPVPEATSSRTSVKPGDRLVWLNFGGFSNELIVACLDDGDKFQRISATLKQDSRQSLERIPSVGEVTTSLT